MAWPNDVRSPFWQGFLSTWMYAGAYLIAAPLWMREWDRPMKKMLRLKSPNT